jgi:hypothetical protein
VLLNLPGQVRKMGQWNFAVLPVEPYQFGMNRPEIETVPLGQFDGGGVDVLGQGRGINLQTLPYLLQDMGGPLLRHDEVFQSHGIGRGSRGRSQGEQGVVPGFIAGDGAERLLDDHGRIVDLDDPQRNASGLRAGVIQVRQCFAVVVCWSYL